MYETNNYLTKKYTTNVNFNFSYFFIYMQFLLICTIKKFKTNDFFFFFNHMKITNFNILLLLLFNLFSIIIFLILDFFFKKKILKNNEATLTIFFYFYILQFFFFVNNLFSFIIILEFQSIVLLYFILTTTTEIKYKSKSLSNNKSISYINQENQHFTNSLLFNYWMSFFGSLIIMFSIINIEKVFGFLQWDQIHFFSLMWQQQIFNYSYIFLFFFWVPFFFGFLIKISYLPFHVWKPEMYKGLSFFSVFFFYDDLFFFIDFVNYLYFFFLNLLFL